LFDELLQNYWNLFQQTPGVNPLRHLVRILADGAE
jgi:hypothetical protein